MRVILTAFLALGLVAGLSASDADAKPKKPKNKQCKATAFDGKKVSFKCKGGETCCYDYGLNKGVCKKASEVCL